MDEEGTVDMVGVLTDIEVMVADVLTDAGIEVLVVEATETVGGIAPPGS